MTRFAFYDPKPDPGHYAWLAEPIATELVARGHDVTVFRPESAWRTTETRVRRVPVVPVGHVRPARSYFRDLPRHRRSLGSAVGAARELGVEVFVDLELDSNVWVSGAFSTSFHLVHLQHGGNQLGAKFGRRRYRRLLTAARHHLYRRTYRRAARILCFMPATELAVRNLAPDAPTQLTGYPVVSRRDLVADGPPARDGALGIEGPPTSDGRRRRMVLLPRQLRPDAHFDVVADAVALLEGELELRIVGNQGRWALDLPERIGRHTVVVDNRLVPEAEMRAAHGRAAMVVSLADDDFVSAGRARGSVIKAVAYGTPLVTHPAYVGTAPAGYPAYGADVEAESVASAIRAALATPPERRAEAEQVGPEHIGRHHSFESFADALEAVGEEARAPTRPPI